ncbi:TetR/AcrR family transcriptional regulator [Rhodococcus sp. NPDC127530]|uniref:TetR/AcrR family transcriptional regulator n=1 Tax=unclassified Rhodococcus (in: high G+C Gram-positive bacteria) TaxID=192944 RepID=UPI00362A667F
MTTNSTRSRLLATARELLARGGSPSVGLTELSKASGVSNGSIYHHFGSKDGVLAAVLIDAVSIYQQEAKALLDQHRDDLEAAVGAIVRHRLFWARSNAPLARLLLEEREFVVAPAWRDQLKALNDEFRAHSRQWLDHQTALGNLPAIPISLAHPIVFAPAEEIARLWLRGQLEGDPIEFAAPLADAAVAGLRSMASHSNRTDQ